MDKDLLEKAREYAQESLIQEREDAQEQEHQIDHVGYVVNTFIKWRGWYCKKNQPKNYMRLMCRKPDHEHWKNVRATWNCRLQIFKGPKFEYDIRMTADVYETFCDYIDNYVDGWKPKQEESELYEYRIYENPQAK